MTFSCLGAVRGKTIPAGLRVPGTQNRASFVFGKLVLTGRTLDLGEGIRPRLFRRPFVPSIRGNGRRGRNRTRRKFFLPSRRTSGGGDRGVGSFRRAEPAGDALQFAGP